MILPCPVVTGNGQIQPLQPKSTVLRPLTNEGWVTPRGKPLRPAEMIANGKVCLTNLLLLSFPLGREVHGTLEKVLSEKVWRHRSMKYRKWSVAVIWISLQKRTCIRVQQAQLANFQLQACSEFISDFQSRPYSSWAAPSK